ncbi:hypothetical protein BpV2_157 [Bathycoccus sp. RCC1105 virus BpV2]|nr:hypothetical protein BpV2_157 [Bathycoccus sp. RCC1105 virus BpV2]
MIICILKCLSLLVISKKKIIFQIEHPSQGDTLYKIKKSFFWVIAKSDKHFIIIIMLLYHIQYDHSLDTYTYNYTICIT